MARLTDKLLVVQERDRKILQLEQELLDIPLKKQENEQRLNTFKAELENSKEEQKHIQVKINECDLETKARQEKIDKLRQQQLQLKSNEEFRVLEKEVATIKKEMSSIEDDELVVMDELDKDAAGAREIQAKLKDAEGLVAHDNDALDQRRSNIETDLEDVRKARAEAANEIEDPRTLAAYERIFSNKRDYALVEVKNKACGGCHMNLPPNRILDAKKAQSLVACDFCGRLLYVV